MYCFGIAHHSPEQVLAFLQKNNMAESCKDVVIVADGLTVSPALKRRIVFVLDAQSFSRNLRILNSPNFDTAMVFVFASSLKIGEFHGCFPLDYDKSEEFGGVATQPKRLSVQKLKSACKHSVTVKRVAEDYLASMVDCVKQGSLLTPLMTFIYTLPSSTHQTPVKEACAQFFRQNLDFDYTMRCLSKRGVDLTPTAQAKLRTILESESAQKFKAFFQKYKARTEDSSLDSLCAQFSVPPYEIRYILSVVGESKSSASTTRSKKKRSKQ